jgi:hypothetical protein
MSPQKRVSRARLRATLMAQHNLEDQAVREQLRLLVDMRRSVLRALGEASGFRLFNLSQVLAAIDRAIGENRTISERLASSATTRAYRLGTELVDGAVAIGPGGLAGISPELLAALLDVTNDQLRSVWSELGTSLKGTVRRAALGIADPFEAMKQVAKTIVNPKVYGSAMARAETIIRTEVNRTFSIATQKRMDQSDERLRGGLKKYWLDADDDRVRDAHREAGKAYGLGGDPGPIPVGKPFIVDGEKLMFPRDPKGSAGNTINCRCVSVPYVGDVADVRVSAPIKLAS